MIYCGFAAVMLKQLWVFDKEFQFQDRPMLH